MGKYDKVTLIMGASIVALQIVIGTMSILKGVALQAFLSGLCIGIWGMVTTHEVFNLRQAEER